MRRELIRAGQTRRTRPAGQPRPQSQLSARNDRRLAGALPNCGRGPGMRAMRRPMTRRWTAT